MVLAPRDLVLEETQRRRNARGWTPFPGPQLAAFLAARTVDDLGYGGAGGGGKALYNRSMIPTPTGWIELRDLSVGDHIFDETGAVCRVTATSKVFLDHDCYEVVFDDGERIVADAEHRWWTLTVSDREALHKRSDEYRARRRATRPSRGTGKRPDLSSRNQKSAVDYQSAPVVGGVRTTKEIAETLVVGRQKNHSVPIAGALDLPEASLPVPPYALGAWLGDGNSRTGRIYLHDDDSEILDRIRAEGFNVRKIESDKFAWCVLGLAKPLRLAGFRTNKHIPSLYLRASIKQRFELLRGLMDTDGTCDKDGGAEFTGTNERLCRDVLELARSLGLKATLITGRAILRGKDCGAKYRVKITTNHQIFHLSRKSERQNKTVRATQTQRYIVECNRVPTVDTQCIAVDSPNHLYLAGSFVPTHNTDLELGLGLLLGRRTIIYRRTYNQLSGIEDRADVLYRRFGKFNGSRHVWKLTCRADISGKPTDPVKRLVRFGSIDLEKHKEKWRGIPFDTRCFDEAQNFTESQVSFVTAWTRTSTPGQHCVNVYAFNPPTTPEGMWLLDWFGPWIDPRHTNPAQPGEVRYFISNTEGKQEEVSSPEPVEIQGRMVTPRSRTFFKALASHNPIYMETGYLDMLNALPEPLRSQMRDGNFAVGLEDDQWQVIPTLWVLAAQERWRNLGSQKRPRGNKGELLPLTGVGVDVAAGGADRTVISRKVGPVFLELMVFPGRSTPDGNAIAQHLIPALEGSAVWPNIDSVGVGQGLVTALNAAKVKFNGINTGSTSYERARASNLPFDNLRAELHWRLREALDPENGQEIALPDDRQLLRELTAPRWALKSGVIEIEKKQKYADERLGGKSPDLADAVLLANYSAATAAWGPGVGRR